MEDVVEELPQTIGDLIIAREEAMKNHLEIRMSNKLRQAILGKTRPTPDEKNVGEIFYFKRANDARWKGPGIVSDSVRGQADLLRVTEPELKA